jgi:hypothetical protein
LGHGQTITAARPGVSAELTFKLEPAGRDRLVLQPV